MESNARTSPRMSVVIPSWFTKSQHGKYGEHETFWLAAECLDRLLERTPRGHFELIIIDNGSSLETADVMESSERGKYAGNGSVRTLEWYFGQADIIISNRDNRGFAAGCNQGFAVARGKYVCCLNNDVVVYDGWHEEMLKPFHEELEVPAGVVMPALIRETRDAREALALEHPDLSLNSGKLGAGAEFGSMWMARTDVLRSIAASSRRDGTLVFDEGFVNGKEDRLLWMEVRNMGMQTYRTHETRVFHQGQMSCAKVKDRRAFSPGNAELLEKYRSKYSAEYEGK